MMASKMHIRPAVARDQHDIADLMFFETHVHRHLDWRTPIDWLGSPLYWVLEHNNKVDAVLACPQDKPEIAWIRLFTHTERFSSREAWQALWQTAQDDLSQRKYPTTVAALTLHNWYTDLLKESGFKSESQVISMEWEQADAQRKSLPRGIIIRAMEKDDLEQVAVADAAAFSPIWQNSLSILEQAYPQAVTATIAEDEEGCVVGYQISTKSPFGAHLARLAVHPKVQRNGIASALISHLTQQLKERGISRLSVNTQSDNLASQAVYQKNGFVETGLAYPVYTFEVPARGESLNV